MNHTTATINLGDYLTPGAKVFTGRDRGQEVRKRSKINDLANTSSKLTIQIPNQVRSINPSFLEEFLVDVVRQLGREAFLQRVEFTKAQRYDVTEDLEEAIDRILTEENALAA